MAQKEQIKELLLSSDIKSFKNEFGNTKDNFIDEIVDGLLEILTKTTHERKAIATVHAEKVAINAMFNNKVFLSDMEIGKIAGIGAAIQFLEKEQIKEEVENENQPLSNKTIPEVVDEKILVTDESNVTLIQTVEILDGEVKGIESIMESIGWSEQVENELEEATDAKRKIKTQLEKLENPHYMADPRKEVRRLFNDGLTSLSCAYDYLSEHITNIMNRGDSCRNQSLVSLSESIEKRGRKIEGMKIPR